MSSAVFKKRGHFCSFDEADRVLRQSIEAEWNFVVRGKMAAILNDGCNYNSNYD